MKPGTPRVSPSKVLALLFGVVLLAMPWLATSLTNTIEIPPTNSAGITETEVTPDSLKPDGCIGPTPLNNLRTGPEIEDETITHDLVLGSANPETLRGGPGDDCLVSGAGNDTLIGGDGGDVCIGSPTDIYDVSCEVQDTSGA